MNGQIADAPLGGVHLREYRKYSVAAGVEKNRIEYKGPTGADIGEFAMNKPVIEDDCALQQAEAGAVMQSARIGGARVRCVIEPISGRKFGQLRYYVPHVAVQNLGARVQGPARFRKSRAAEDF